MNKHEDYEYRRRGGELLTRIGWELYQLQEKNGVKPFKPPENVPEIPASKPKPKTIQLNLDLDI